MSKMEYEEIEVGIEQKSDKVCLSESVDETYRIEQICIEDWQEAMFIHHTDRFSYVSSSYILKFYKEFIIKIQQRYEQFDCYYNKLAQEIKAYVEVCFDEKSIEKIDRIFGLILTSVLNSAVHFTCIQSDYSLFFAIDCISQYILNFGTSDDIIKQNFAINIANQYMERPSRFWPIFSARIFEKTSYTIPIITEQNQFSLKEKLLTLKYIDLYSKILSKQLRTNHPNDITIAGCWIRNAHNELLQANLNNNLCDNLFFLEIITLFLTNCKSMILKYHSDWTKVLSDIKNSLITIDSSIYQVLNLQKLIYNIEENIQQLIENEAKKID